MPEDQEVVTLRDVLPEDLPILFEHQRQPAANAMAAFPARDWDTFVAHWTKISNDENNITRAVVLNGEVAGNIGSWEQDGRREIGYWIGMEHWGKGVATKAVSAFLRQVETRPLYAHVAKHNVASLRVLEKCGFTIVEEEQAGPGQVDDDVEELILRLDRGEGDRSSLLRS
jgi:RimJ/RimL family protein N-acetyltransferase